jgi:hypothetical protein
LAALIDDLRQPSFDGFPKIPAKRQLAVGS